MKCKEDGCNNIAKVRGYCVKHYDARLLYSKKYNKCFYCEEDVVDKNLCAEHLKTKFSRIYGQCRVDGCDGRVHMRGYCKEHYYQYVLADKHKTLRKTINGRYREGKRSAKRRNIEWLLTIEQYEKIVEDGTCFYCGENIPEQGGGIDRIDNSLGYTEENSVACCQECNRIKGAVLTFKEMIEVAKLLKGIRSEDGQGIQFD